MCSMNKVIKNVNFLIAFLLTSSILFPLSYGQPTLISSDNVAWSFYPEDGYMVYSRDIVQSRNMPIYVDIGNLFGDSFRFGWKQNANYDGIFGNMKFTTDGSSAQSLDENSSDFTVDLGPYPINNVTKYQFELNFKKGGKVWIRFPISENRTPRIELVPENRTPTIELVPENRTTTIELAPENKTLPLENLTEFFVKSDEEFREALNNSSLNKLIYMDDTEFRGQFLIKNSMGHMRIQQRVNNGVMPIINGINGCFAIAIEDSSNVSIDGLMITNAYVGLLLEDDVYCSITNCTIRNFDLDGISLNNSSGTFIKDNEIISLNPHNHETLTGINLTKCRYKCELKNNTISLDGGNNSPIPIAILLDRSQGNDLSVKPQNGEEYLIFEDDVDWAIRCNGSSSCCRRGVSMNCDCPTFSRLSRNRWHLCGN